LILTICILAGSLNFLSGAPPQKFYDRKYKNRTSGLPYATVSGGAGLGYISTQPGMNNNRMPYSVVVEYGRTSLPVSVVAGTFFRTTFAIDHFMLSPTNVFVGLQFAPLRGTPASKKFNLYGVGGFNVGHTIYTEDLYPEIVNYVNKTERSTGLGVAAGIGMGYRYNSLELKPMLYYFSGQADFLAGHFTEQRFSTGSMQFHLSLSYHILFNRSGRTCPAFRKYYRI
jgi:hypothetical protein